MLSKQRLDLRYTNVYFKEIKRRAIQHWVRIVILRIKVQINYAIALKLLWVYFNKTLTRHRLNAAFCFASFAQ